MAANHLGCPPHHRSSDRWKRETAGGKSYSDDVVDVNCHEHLQIRDPIGFVNRTQGACIGRPGVSIGVVTAQMRMNDAPSAVVVTMLVEMGVHEGGAQRPSLQGQRQPDRDHAAQHGGLFYRDSASGIRNSGSRCRGTMTGGRTSHSGPGFTARL